MSISNTEKQKIIDFDNKPKPWLQFSRKRFLLTSQFYYLKNSKFSMSRCLFVIHECLLETQKSSKVKQNDFKCYVHKTELDPEITRCQAKVN